MGGVGDELALGLERGFEPFEQLVDGVPELVELVVGPASASRSCRFCSEIWRAALVIVRRGRRARPATIQPSPIAITAMIASAIPDWTKSAPSAAAVSRWAAAITSGRGRDARGPDRGRATSGCR